MIAMRQLILYWLSVLSLATAFEIPQIQSFLSAISNNFDDFLPALSISNETAQEQAQQLDLRKRQYSNTCPKHFSNCDNLGAPSLCCANGAVCSADAAGHVACCPIGAACTGTIGGVITAGTVNSIGSLMSQTATITTTGSFVPVTTSNGLVVATSPTAAVTQTAGQYNPSTSGRGFVVDGTSTVATPGAAVRGAQIVSRPRVKISGIVC